MPACAATATKRAEEDAGGGAPAGGRSAGGVRAPPGVSRSKAPAPAAHRKAPAPRLPGIFLFGSDAFRFTAAFHVKRGWPSCRSLLLRPQAPERRIGRAHPLAGVLSPASGRPALSASRPFPAA